MKTPNTSYYRLDPTADVVRNSIEGLMHQHFKEVSTEDIEESLDLDWDRYVTLYDQGSLSSFGAVVDGVLVGYVCLVTTRPMHYKGMVIAVSDTIYVSPSFRNSTIGLRLIKMAEEDVKTRGAEFVHWYVKPDSPLEKIFLNKKGVVRDVVISRRL